MLTTDKTSTIKLVTNKLQERIVVNTILIEPTESNAVKCKANEIIPNTDDVAHPVITHPLFTVSASTYVATRKNKVEKNKNPVIMCSIYPLHIKF